MVLTIKNFESQNVWPWVVETAPTNLVWVAGVLKATLTWTSATGESWVTWTEEKLVRKEWSAPTWSMDWTTVATITTKDTYASTGYEDTGLDSTKTYYYKVFAIYDNGTEMWSSDVNVQPTELSYELFDETIISNSTTGSDWVIASVNWYFIRPSYSFATSNWAYWITTKDWYDVISADGFHSNCHIGISDATLNTLLSYSKIKIVIDYFNIGGYSWSYFTNTIKIWDVEWYYYNRWVYVFTKRSWISLEGSTWYSLEQEIDTSDMSTRTKITKISTQETQEVEYTKSFRKETASEYIINWWWPIICLVARDQAWWPVVMWNIHIYVKE